MPEREIVTAESEENAELREKNNELEVAVGELMKEIRFLKKLVNEIQAGKSEAS